MKLHDVKRLARDYFGFLSDYGFEEPVVSRRRNSVRDWHVVFVSGRCTIEMSVGEDDESIVTYLEEPGTGRRLSLDTAAEVPPYMARAWGDDDVSAAGRFEAEAAALRNVPDVLRGDFERFADRLL